MCTFVAIKNTKIRSLCKPLEIELKKNFFLCKLLRAVTLFILPSLLLLKNVKSYDKKTGDRFQVIQRKMRHVSAVKTDLDE